MDAINRKLSTGSKRKGSTDDAADANLAKLGYESKLPRNLSMLSILGLSFAIIAAPFGSSTTLYIALTDGQAVTVIWGWILVTSISLCIAASLAEICSVYPTAGGVYYWSAQLSKKEYAPIVSWIDGWFNLVGNWTVTLSINFSGGQLILSAITLWKDDFIPNAWQTVRTDGQTPSQCLINVLTLLPICSGADVLGSDAHLFSSECIRFSLPRYD